LIKIKRPTS